MSRAVAEPRSRRHGSPATALLPRGGVPALLVAFAGVVHLSLVPEHVAEWWGFGVFFLATATVQLLGALLLLWRPGTTVATALILANAAVAAVYVLSRTSGVPVGPAHSSHRLEPVGALDLTTTVAEVMLIAMLVPSLPDRDRRRVANALVALGAGLWIIRATGRLP